MQIGSFPGSGEPAFFSQGLGKWSPNERSSRGVRQSGSADGIFSLRSIFSRTTFAVTAGRLPKHPGDVCDEFANNVEQRKL
jgi:hypothetical protein